MTQSSASGRLGAVKLSLLMAVAGFCYALASQQLPRAGASVDGSAAGAEPRVLGTFNTRNAVQFLTTSDLGAVVVGTQFARQILVLYGFRPHVYTFGNTQPNSTKLTLSRAGKLSGMETTTGADIFDVVVTDTPAGKPLPPIIRTFGILAVDQQFGTPLHFETGAKVASPLPTQNITLPVALAGDVYYYTFQGNGGHPPYLFEVQEQTSGRFVPQGLAFDAKNAQLFGKPAVPTLAGAPANIDVRLTDSAGGQVLGHFSLTVVQGTISSQAVATQGSIKLQFGNADGRDSLDLTLVLDKSDLGVAGIRTAADLAGLPFEMNFGGYTLPPDARAKSNTTILHTFTAAGRIDVPRHHLVGGDVVGSGVTDVVYSIVLDPKKGILKAHFENLKMIAAIGANFLTFEGQTDPINRGPVIPINIKLGLNPAADVASAKTVLDRTDLIKFAYKRTQNVGSGSARINDNSAPAGIFLISKVTGNEQQVVIDQFNHIKADRIFLRMSGIMRQPGAKPVVPLNSDRVDVFVNQLNIGSFPANSFAVKGTALVFSNNDPTKGLQTLTLDNKTGKVTITTNGLDPNDKLFGADVLIAGDPEQIPITLTIGGNNVVPTFDGQSTVTLFRAHNSIKNK